MCRLINKYDTLSRHPVYRIILLHYFIIWFNPPRNGPQVYVQKNKNLPGQFSLIIYQSQADYDPINISTEALFDCSIIAQ